MRLIDADKLSELIKELIQRWNPKNEYGLGRINSYEFVMKVIETNSTVTVNCKDCDGYEAGYSAGIHDATRPIGEWIQYRKGHYTGVKCSLCDTIMDFTTNYCPKCGAKMTK